MTSRSEVAYYIDTSQRVLRCVQRWAKAHPAAELAWNGLALDDETPIVADLSVALRDFAASSDARELGAAVVLAVQDATWSMFASALQLVYGRSWRRAAGQADA